MIALLAGLHAGRSNSEAPPQSQLSFLLWQIAAAQRRESTA